MVVVMGASSRAFELGLVTGLVRAAQDRVRTPSAYIIPASITIGGGGPHLAGVLQPGRIYAVVDAEGETRRGRLVRRGETYAIELDPRLDEDYAARLVAHRRQQNGTD